MACLKMITETRTPGGNLACLMRCFRAISATLEVLFRRISSNPGGGGPTTPASPSTLSMASPEEAQGSSSGEGQLRIEERDQRGVASSPRRSNSPVSPSLSTVSEGANDDHTDHEGKSIYLSPFGVSTGSSDLLSGAPGVAVTPASDTSGSVRSQGVEPERLPTADDVLPATIMVVLRANPPRLLSHLEYVLQYRRPARMTAESHYFLVTLQSAAHFLKDLNGRKIDMAPEDFEKRLHAAADLDRADAYGYSVHGSHGDESEGSFH